MALGYFELFQLVRRSNFPGMSQIHRKTDEILQPLLMKYDVLFKINLPAGILSESNFDHEIVIEDNVQPPNRLLL